MSQPKVSEGVYVLYSKGKVVYVGESENVYARISQHINQNVKDFDSFDVYETPDRKRLEGFLIEAFRPKYNERPGMNWHHKEHTDALFTRDDLAYAVETYKKDFLYISTADISDIIGLQERLIIEAIYAHENEIPAWRHEDCRWCIDYEWFINNKDSLMRWALDEAERDDREKFENELKWWGSVSNDE